MRIAQSTFPSAESIRLIVSFLTNATAYTRPLVSRRLGAALVVLVIGASLFFRFEGLGRKVLWHDELATRVFAAGYTVEEWQEELFDGHVVDVSEVQKWQRLAPDRGVTAGIRDLAARDPQHPPLYYVLARFWVVLFGDGLGTLRALSAIAGALGLAAAYWLSREAFRSTPAAWTTVAVVGFSPFFVLYAQEAREYALWIAFLLVSCASLLRAIRLSEHETRADRATLVKVWTIFSVSTALSLYTSFTSASVILAQLAFLALRERGPTRVARHAFVAYAAAAIAFLPWAVNLLRRWGSFADSMRWAKEIVIPRTSLLRILGHNAMRSVADFGLEVDGPLGWIVMLATSALIAIALVSLVRATPERVTRSPIALIVLMIAIPIGMLLVPDLLFGGIRSVSTRYLTPAWVAIAIALGAFLAARPPLAAAVLAVAFASSALNVPKVAVWTKSTSILLPQVAEHVNAAPSALVAGSLERHNPGNMMALSILLKPGTKMQFLRAEKEERWALPRDQGTVFLLCPINVYREALARRENVTPKLLVEDTSLDLWKIEP